MAKPVVNAYDALEFVQMHLDPSANHIEGKAIGIVYENVPERASLRLTVTFEVQHSEIRSRLLHPTHTQLLEAMIANGGRGELEEKG